MAGRPKQRIYVYNLDGSFKEWFDSQSDFRDKYFKSDIGKRPILVKEERLTTPRLKDELIKYNIYKDMIVFGRRIYRDDIRYLIQIDKSEFCKKSDSKYTKAVQVLNLKKEVIATFKNVRLLTKAMPHIPESFVWHYLNKSQMKNKYNDYGLFFRYKLSSDDVIGEAVKNSDAVVFTETDSIEAIKEKYPNLDWFHTVKEDGTLGIAWCVKPKKRERKI